MPLAVSRGGFARNAVFFEGRQSRRAWHV